MVFLVKGRGSRWPHLESLLYSLTFLTVLTTVGLFFEVGGSV